MSTSLFGGLRHLKDASFYPGADISLFDKLEREYGITLPSDHRDVLQESNGAQVYTGYFRLFGIFTATDIDAIKWNQKDCWKFAWGGRCSGYWCFGETAWGDQYAYATGASSSGEVYFLDALSMTPQIVASCFAEFFEKEFIRSAKDPYDVMIKQARQKLGTLEVASHLVYMPSILLGGADDISNVEKMNARAAMICNGDIATQIDAAPSDKVVKGVQPYEDESHRLRLRLVWGDSVGSNSIG